jgi:hypothetical protein
MCASERGEREREGSGQFHAWLDQVESVGPSWSGPGLGQTIGPFGPYFFLFISFPYEILSFKI